tara:strand:- start:15019 stop:15267 length:249 start_codon:yes stop_codon:yes gene_type:complete
MTNKLYLLISKIFSITYSEINSNSNPENISQWDSLNTYILVDEIEKNFDVKFTLDEIVSITNVGDIEKILKNKNCDLIDNEQ